MKFGSFPIIGLALALAMMGSSIAQDSGGAASAVTGSGADQGNGGTRGGTDVDTIFASKGKGGKGMGASLKPQLLGKPQVGPKLSNAGTATGDSRTGTLSDKASTPAGSPVTAPPLANRAPNSPGISTAAASGAVINGTAMIPPAARSGAVRGSTKALAGVLSGNNFTPKHP